MEYEEDDLPVPQGAADMSAFAHILPNLPQPERASRAEPWASNGRHRGKPGVAASQYTQGKSGGQGRRGNASVSASTPHFKTGARMPKQDTSAHLAGHKHFRNQGPSPSGPGPSSQIRQNRQGDQARQRTNLNKPEPSIPGGRGQGTPEAASSTGRRKGAVGSEQAAPSNDSEVEELSKFKLKSRGMPAEFIRQRLDGVPFHKLRVLRSLLVGEDLPRSWATAGILIKKGQTKQSATGNPYACWGLSSLSGAIMVEANVLLLGTAFTQHWKEVEGTVVIIVGAEASAGSLGYSSAAFLKATSGDQILPVGVSASFGICKGGQVDGLKPCSTIINKSHGEYCSVHIGESYKKFNTRRMELGGGQFTTTTFLFKAKKLRRTKEVSLVDADSNTKRAPRTVTADDMKDLLKNKENMTSRTSSQGKRFLLLASGQKPHADNLGKLPPSAAVALGKRAERERVSAPGVMKDSQTSQHGRATH